MLSSERVKNLLRQCIFHTCALMPFDRHYSIYLLFGLGGGGAGGGGGGGRRGRKSIKFFFISIIFAPRAVT